MNTAVVVTEEEEVMNRVARMVKATCMLIVVVGERKVMMVRRRMVVVMVIMVVVIMVVMVRVIVVMVLLLQLLCDLWFVNCLRRLKRWLTWENVCTLGSEFSSTEPRIKSWMQLLAPTLAASVILGSMRHTCFINILKNV